MSPRILPCLAIRRDGWRFAFSADASSVGNKVTITLASSTDGLSLTQSGQVAVIIYGLVALQYFNLLMFDY